MPLALYLTILVAVIGAAGLTIALLTQSLAPIGVGVAVLAVTALLRWKT